VEDPLDRGVRVARRMADRAGPLPPIPVNPAPFLVTFT